MSAPLKDISMDVMQKIESGQVKMRPRWYFVVGSVLALGGLVLSFVSSAFFFSILHLSLREGGRGMQWKLTTLQEMFHWWIPLLALTSLLLGIWLLRRYEFSYRRHFTYVIGSFVLAVLMASSLFVLTGAHETLTHQGPMRDLVKPWQQDKTGFEQFRENGAGDQYRGGRQ